jgi:DNA-binding transcriptional regulator YdaS (Cro superfamily)
MSACAALDRAIQIAGSEAKLAALAGCSQPAINKAKHKGVVSPGLAAMIDRGLGGRVQKYELRPDVFDAPSAVVETG